ALAFSDAAIQFAAVAGAYGLGFALALCCAAPAALADSVPGNRWRPVGCAAALLAALWAGGALRLHLASQETVPGVVLRIVQGNVAQQTKSDPALVDRHLALYLRLSGAPAGPAGAPTHLVWPETAVPVIFVADPGRSQAAGAAVPPGGLLLT